MAAPRSLSRMRALRGKRPPRVSSKPAIWRVRDLDLFFSQSLKDMKEEHGILPPFFSLFMGERGGVLQLQSREHARWFCTSGLPLWTYTISDRVLHFCREWNGHLSFLSNSHQGSRLGQITSVALAPTGVPARSKKNWSRWRCGGTRGGDPRPTHPRWSDS